MVESPRHEIAAGRFVGPIVLYRSFILLLVGFIKLYYIMKKLLSAVLACTFSSSVFAMPYSLTDPQVSRPVGFGCYYAIDHIVNLQSVQYTVVDEPDGLAAQVDVKRAYQVWFENLRNRVLQEERSEFDFMLPVLEFGVSDEVAVPRTQILANETLLVYILPGSDSYWRDFPRFTSGTFLKTNTHMEIRLKQNSAESSPSVLWHEAGHSLGVADSYFGGSRPSDFVYGSERRTSLMGEADFLTCDDADALANAVYLHMKKNKKTVPDNFAFESFCPAKEGESSVRFLNGKQLNRPPFSAFSDGKYYWSEFCPDGDLKSVMEIDPYAALPVSVTVKKQCGEPAAEYAAPQPPENDSETNYVLVNLLDNKRQKILFSPNTVVWEYAPNIVREITFDGDLFKTMVQVKNHTGALLYVFAVLDQSRAFAYRPLEDVMVLFDVNDYGKYVIKTGDTVRGTTQFPDAAEVFSSMKTFISKTRRWPQGNFVSMNLVLSDFVAQAAHWQNYVREFYPHPDFRLRKADVSKKAVEKLIRQMRSN